MTEEKYKTLKIKLYPTIKQQKQLQHWSNCCRYVYNWAISERKKHWELHEQDYRDGKKIPGLSAFDQSNILTQYKQQKEKTWLLSCPSVLFVTTLNRVQEGYNLFFREVKKSQKHLRQSFVPKIKRHFSL